MRDATINSLQRELNNMANVINSQLAEAKNTLMKKDIDLKIATDEMESLKKALSNQEEFTKTVCEQNSGLQDKQALLEEEHQKLLVTNDTNKTALEEMSSTCEKLNNNIVTLREENQALIKEVNDKREMLTLYEEELELFKKQLLDADTKIDRITLDFNETANQSIQKTARIEILETEIDELGEKLDDFEDALTNYREAAENKEKKLSEIIQERNDELDVKTSTIIQASFNLQTEKEERAKLEMESQQLKREWEMEMEKAREKERMLKTRVTQFEAAVRAKDEELSREMTKFLHERNEMRDATINSLQRELNNMANVINSQLAEAKNTLMKKDIDLKIATDEMESLKKALSNQEEFTKTVCEQNSGLQDKQALLEEEHQKLLVTNDTNKTALEEMSSTCEKLNNNIVTLREENQALIKEVNDKREMLTLYEEELELFKKQLLDADTKIDRITLDFNETANQSIQKTARIEILETEIDELGEKLDDFEDALTNYREAAENKEKKLSAIIQERNDELDVKTSTIIQASFNLQTEKEERAKLEMESQQLKREWEMEMEKAREKERMLKTRVTQFEAAVRAKDEELSREMTKFLHERNEMEKEKSALQEKIRGLEKRINNIMQEASNARGEPALFKTEPDDVAVMLTPQGTQDYPKSGSPILQVPQRMNSDDMAFDYFSEPSVDSLDTANVQHRFAALSRGQLLAPELESLASLKRHRRPDTPVHGQAAPLYKAPNDVFTAPQPKTKERRFFKNVRPNSNVKVDKPKKKKLTL